MENIPEIECVIYAYVGCGMYRDGIITELMQKYGVTKAEAENLIHDYNMIYACSNVKDTPQKPSVSMSIFEWVGVGLQRFEIRNKIMRYYGITPEEAENCIDKYNSFYTHAKVQGRSREPSQRR